MQEKELRIALVCYGGVSLAVYMHGITKEIWRLAKASQAVHAGEAGRRRRLCGAAPPHLRRGGDRSSGAGRHPRRGQRGRHQRHLPRPCHRHRTDARSADRSVARFRRYRRPARSRRQCRVARRQICGRPGRLGAHPARRDDRQDGRARPPGRDQGQARQFRARALVRAALRRAAIHQPAARRVRCDGRGAEGRAAAARLSAARPVRHRHRLSTAMPRSCG